MSSSPSSSSSSSAPEPPAPEDACAGESPFRGFLSVRCTASVVLGTGTITVRECVALEPQSVLRLSEAAGEDLQLRVGPILIARGEVVIVEDSTALRLTEIAPSHDAEARA
jgi:flagellar motor switch protein FliN